MSQSLEKETPRRLDKIAYKELRLEVLRRDSWRCQFCGSMNNLEVHQQTYRSHLGQDTSDNLVTLCANCHNTLHVHLQTKNGAKNA